MRFGRFALGFSVFGIGCSSVFSYPSPVAELGTGLCSDGTDNDFDGTIDCLDPDCDGYCEETSETACKDGRDNDGDGLIDARDPRCFPIASPSVQRCASNDASTFLESFDGTLSEERWYPLGSFSSLSGLSKGTTRQARFDQVLQVSSIPIQSGIATRPVFDGDWNNLRLAFSAKVPAEWTATIALVPSSLAYENQPLLSGAQSLMAITLNGCHDKTMIVLTVPGQSAIAPFTAGQWTSLDLRRDSEQFSLFVDGKVGAGLPLNTNLAPSRIALTVAPCSVGPNQTGQVEIDDLVMSLGGTMPCGFPSPQIPILSSCRYKLNQEWSVAVGVLEPTGQSLAAAQRADGTACSVVEAIRTGTTAVSSWSSTDGITWSPGGELRASEALAGAAIAWNPSTQKWRAVTTELASDDQILVNSYESTDCSKWSQAGNQMSLPPNTESPSLLIPGMVDAEELYYTAGPFMKNGRTLWRANLNGGQGTQVTQFAIDLPVDPPVSIVRLGKTDIVATHVLSPSSGHIGLGLLVAMNDSLTEWKSANPLTATLLDYRLDRAGFDRDGILSGVLLAGPEFTQLLYTGKGEALSGTRISPDLAAPTVGTAVFLPSGEELKTTSSSFPLGLTRQPDLCGNGTCETDESCQLCTIDCGVCSGRALLSDRFANGNGWTWLSTEGAERVGGPYWNESMGKISSGSLDTTTGSKETGVDWLVKSLTEAVSGDFELSFDFLMGAGSDDTQQAFYVGLADSASVEQGGFVEFRRSGATIVLRSVSRAAGKTLTSATQALLIGDTTARVFLTRKSGEMIVSALGIDQCVLSTNVPTVTYPSSGTLSTIAIGYDYRWSSLTQSSGNAFIDNLVLRIEK